MGLTVAEGIRDRVSRPSLVVVAAFLASMAPLPVLVVPALLHLPAVEPLLHESELFPPFSRASLVALPLAGLAIVNVAIFAATRSLRYTLVASVVTTTLALLLIVGAVDLVNDLNEMFGGAD